MATNRKGKKRKEKERKDVELMESDPFSSGITLVTHKFMHFTYTLSLSWTKQHSQYSMFNRLTLALITVQFSILSAWSFGMGAEGEREEGWRTEGWVGKNLRMDSLRSTLYTHREFARGTISMSMSWVMGIVQSNFIQCPSVLIDTSTPSMQNRLCYPKNR